MTNSITFSIIIPVYNVEKILSQCLGSVLQQTKPATEIIIVDNGSTDNTSVLIKEWQFRYDQIKYLFEPCRTRGAARNTGVAAATGDILVMTDADCLVPANWIEVITKPIIAAGEVAVTGYEYPLVDNYWTRYIQKRDDDLIAKSTSGKYINHLDTKNFAIRADIAKTIQFDRQMDYLEDFDFFLRFKRTYRVRFLPDLKVGHCHQDSLGGMTRRNFHRGFWLAKIRQKYKRQGSTENETMTQSYSLINFLIFPAWMAWQFVVRPVSEAWPLLLSELSWRAGILWGLVKKI